MKRLILSILLAVLMINITGCVVVDRHHKHAREVVIVSPPARRPGPPPRPHYPQNRRGMNRRGRWDNRRGR
jgi:hypothetical protein